MLESRIEKVSVMRLENGYIANPEKGEVPVGGKFFIPKYQRGYCIATFKQVSDYYLVTKGNAKEELEDGTMVLLPVKVMVSGTSPDKVNNPVGGIVFKEWQYGFSGVTVWFNAADLELTY